MSVSQGPGAGQPTIDWSKFVVPSGPEVILDGVSPALLQYIGLLGRVHEALFGHALVITSGRDGTHAPGSLHESGLAVDIRISDLDIEHQVLFLNVISATCVDWECRVFDERVGPGGPHIHIEYRGA